MEQVKILFYVLSTFFGIADGHIAAEKTEITIYPKRHRIEIVQQGLFTIVGSKKDPALALREWDGLYNRSIKETDFARELDDFSAKDFTIIPVESKIEPHLTFSYTRERDLRTMGIWYNEEKNQFSINDVPQHNIKTKDGKPEGNYWFFDGSKPFSFTLEPFIGLPENHRKSKRTIKELLEHNGKKE